MNFLIMCVTVIMSNSLSLNHVCYSCRPISNILSESCVLQSLSLTASRCRASSCLRNMKPSSHYTVYRALVLTGWSNPCLLLVQIGHALMSLRCHAHICSSRSEQTPAILTGTVIKHRATMNVNLL